MPLSDRDLADIRKMTDDDLVRHAQTVDLAVLVEANVRLRKSTERLTNVLIALTVVLIIIAGFETYRHW